MSGDKAHSLHLEFIPKVSDGWGQASELRLFRSKLWKSFFISPPPLLHTAVCASIYRNICSAHLFVAIGNKSRSGAFECDCDQWGIFSSSLSSQSVHREAVQLHAWHPASKSFKPPQNVFWGWGHLRISTESCCCTHRGKKISVNSSCVSYIYIFIYILSPPSPPTRKWIRITILPLSPEATVNLLLTSPCAAYKRDRQTQAAHPPLDWCFCTTSNAREKEFYTLWHDASLD